ncbi:MAG: helix-turn-helix domain-containing protein [Eubacteriales bacterium]|nr:helix-turn-helix domain-containing protein [Eubacteriales bacterium]
MIRIAIVEDEYPILTGLQHLIEQLSSEYVVVGTASNIHDGLILIKEQKPDLAFCDIKLGSQNGLEMIQTLVDCGIQCHYVILSGFSEFSYAQQAIRLGVIDYLVKPTSTKQISQLLKTFEEQSQQESSSDDLTEPRLPYSKIISYTIKCIHTSYSSALSLSRLAKQTGVTPQYLSALFTKEVGISFVNYLRNYRIKAAEQLLLETDKKISDIAFSVGYDDPQYFCRVFKTVTGSSPKSYRYSKSR